MCGPEEHLRLLLTAVGPFETCRPDLTMSAYPVKPEVLASGADRRL